MIEWIPDRPALTHDRPCNVDALIRICPPEPERSQQRLALNLSLVIDRSGSMGGEKIQLTKRAAALVTRSLKPQDQLSLVLFDDAIEVLLPTTRVNDPQRILRLIEGIQVNGSTALFDGWKSGAGQACMGQDEHNLNRVVLLTDGQANVGETNADRICDEVQRICSRGVQTTTMGFGRDYNENLLRSMAASGEGNHFFVETPDQLSKFFELELDGLNATVGTRVRLRLTPLQLGVVVEPLGEVQRNDEGDYLLADLVAGFPLEQLFRISVPATTVTTPCIEAELRWYSPAQAAHESWQSPLRLPRVSSQERLAMPVHPEVERQLAIAMAARARREATAAANRGEADKARNILEQALTSQALPDLEKAQLQQFKLTLDRGDLSSVNKQSMSYSHAYSRGSVSLSNPEGMMLQAMVGGAIPLRPNQLLSKPACKQPRPWGKLEGTLGGLLAGEARACPAQSAPAEYGQLVLATLGQVRPGARLLPTLGPLVKALAEAPIAHPSPAQLAFRNLHANGKSFLECAVEAPEAGAMARLAPLLLARWGQATPSAWSFIVLGAHVTHNDAMAAAANVAFAKLLLKLMARTEAPDPHAYVEFFHKILQEVEFDREYSPRVARFDGWKGRLSDFLSSVIPEARRRSLNFSEAAHEWGSSPYLLEMVPTLLYLLECHAHQPQVALHEATQGEHASPMLGALVGAALGALHGVLPGCEPQGELATILAEVKSQLGEP